MPRVRNRELVDHQHRPVKHRRVQDRRRKDEHTPREPITIRAQGQQNSKVAIGDIMWQYWTSYGTSNLEINGVRNFYEANISGMMELKSDFLKGIIIRW